MGIIGVENNLGFLGVVSENLVELVLGVFGIDVVFSLVEKGVVVSMYDVVFVSVGWVGLIGLMFVLLFWVMLCFGYDIGF